MGFRIRIAAAAMMAALGVLVFSGTAVANPTAEFAPFADCQFKNPAVELCLYAESSSGSLELGSKTIPLVNPIALQGGVTETGTGTQFYSATSGATLTKAPQPVPGGLIGQTAPLTWPAWLQEYFNEAIEGGMTGLDVTIELAAPASSIGIELPNVLTEEEPAFALPVKFHIENTILGGECYVSSNTEPILLELTSGESGALHGSAGTLNVNGPGSLVTLNGAELVDGTFAAPEASGCGGEFAPYFDPLVNSIFGLPAASGNGFDFEGSIEVAERLAVKAADM